MYCLYLVSFITSIYLVNSKSIHFLLIRVLGQKNIIQNYRPPKSRTRSWSSFPSNDTFQLCPADGAALITVSKTFALKMRLFRTQSVGASRYDIRQKRVRDFVGKLIFHGRTQSGGTSIKPYTASSLCCKAPFWNLWSS